MRTADISYLRYKYFYMKNTIGMEALFNRIRCFLLMALAFLPFSLFSASQTLSFHSVTISEGLSHNTVNTIYKDKRGFIWLGTQIGLDRFDGVNVVNYPQFKGQTVFSVAELDSVFLWVGTDRGLIKFNRKTEVAKLIRLTDKSLMVRHIFVNRTGKLFVSSNQGLFLLEKGTFRRKLFDQNALSLTNNVLKVADGEGDGVWAVTSDGLVYYDVETDKFEVYRNELKGGINDYTCLALMGGSIYLGTANRGMLRFNIRHKSFSLYPDVGNGCITDLIPVMNDTLYIGTNGSGIKVVKATAGKELLSIEHSADENGICSNAVYSLFKDENVLYVGTYMGGLSYTPTHGDVFSVYSYSSLFDSYNMNVRAFYIDTLGQKVIGTRDGLYYISEKEHFVRKYTSKSSLLRSNIILFVKPLKENYLIGTYGGGMYLLHSKTKKLSFFKQDECFMENSFAVCEEDKDGKLWIGASNGVYVYDKITDKYVIYDSRNSSLSGKSIFAVKIDSRNRIWFGGSGAVSMYDKATGVFKSDIFPEHILPYTKSIRYIYEDSGKNLWFCDDKEGVVKVDEHFTKFEHITIDGFLPDNSVGSIVEEPEDRGLWFATQRGLMYMKNGESKMFSLYDGIPSYIFNNSMQVTADGTIWWGNERGLVRYIPQFGYKQSVPSLPPVITSIVVAGKRLRAGDELMPSASTFLEKIALPVKDNNIMFTFSALNYAVENTNLYEYCLDGYDDEWKVIARSNQATYTNLPIGDYVFKVRVASNPDAIKTMKVEIVRGTSFILWIIAFCILVCLFFCYYTLLGKYRRMRARIQGQKENMQDLPKEKYQKSRIEEDEVLRIEKRLTISMEQEKMYLNPDLKLQDVANFVGCNAVDLSQVLNLHKHINFTDYINRYRIEEFIVRVQDKSATRFTLSSLSEQCGFSSRTSFFRSFKKLKGKSPAEYIKEKGYLVE